MWFFILQNGLNSICSKLPGTYTVHFACIYSGYIRFPKVIRNVLKEISSKQADRWIKERRFCTLQRVGVEGTLLTSAGCKVVWHESLSFPCGSSETNCDFMSCTLTQLEQAQSLRLGIKGLSKWCLHVAQEFCVILFWYLTVYSSRKLFSV